MQRVVPQFLQALDGFDRARCALLFLAATNLPWQLDPAVLRPGRFDEKVYVPLPDLAARARLLEMSLRHRPVSDDVDLPELARRRVLVAQLIHALRHGDVVVVNPVRSRIASRLFSRLPSTSSLKVTFWNRSLSSGNSSLKWRDW